MASVFLTLKLPQQRRVIPTQFARSKNYFDNFYKFRKVPVRYKTEAPPLFSAQLDELSTKSVEFSTEPGSASACIRSSVSLIISSSLLSQFVLFFFWCFRRRRIRFPAPGERISSAVFGDDGIFVVGDSNVPSSAERNFSVARIGDEGAIIDHTGGDGVRTDETGGDGVITDDNSGCGPITDDTGGGGEITEDTGGSGPITDDTGGGGPITDDTGGSGPIKDDTGGGGPITDDTGGGGAMVDKSVSTTSGRRISGDEGRGGVEGEVSAAAAVAVSLRSICAKLIRALGS